jgi:hypothetical protein
MKPCGSEIEWVLASAQDYRADTDFDLIRRPATRRGARAQDLTAISRRLTGGAHTA